MCFFFFFSSRRRHTRFDCDWSSDVCSSDLLFPTTTIGSFPQTAEVRAARKQLHDGKLTPQEYDAFIADQIARTLRLQEELGLDVLVHGEFERNDMVEYFGEQLAGFAFTEHGCVQSYGTRYVKPP